VSMLDQCDVHLGAVVGGEHVAGQLDGLPGVDKPVDAALLCHLAGVTYEGLIYKKIGFQSVL